MTSMTSRERVMITLAHGQPDRVPLFLFGLDPKFVIKYFERDVYSALDFLDLDTFTVRIAYWCQGIPTAAPLIMDIPEDQTTGGGIFAGWNGPDEFGRIWNRGSYAGGDLKTWEDLDKYTPALRLEERTPPNFVRRAREKYPEKAFAPIVHLGPLSLSMEGMGYEHFFFNMFDDRSLVKEVIKRRTDFLVAYFQYAQEIGVDYIVMGDDVAYGKGSFISPEDFKELVVPSYQHIVSSVKIPIVWHCDGFVENLLETIVEIGFAGTHPLEPTAHNDMGRIKRRFGDRLTLIGNVDCLNVLSGNDLHAVRAEVDRCMRQAKEGGSYMLDTSNSAHYGTNFEAVKEMYRYGKEVGDY